jgi:uncharacterized protein YjbJ (UPF0337 family)
MDKQQIKGAAKEAAGKVQKKTGEALDDRSMQAKGMAKEAAGKAQKKLGEAKDALHDADRRERHVDDDLPDDHDLSDD